jgi:tetratricopeptide (TPR) repeat protein
VTAGFCLAVAAGAAGPALSQERISAFNSVVILGSVTNSTVNNTIMRETPETLRRLTEVLSKQRESDVRLTEARTQLAELATKLSFTTAALEEVFRTVGHQQIPPERVPQMLTKFAEQFATARDGVAAIKPEAPAARVLRDRAQAELNNGRFNETDRLLAETERVELVAARRVDPSSGQGPLAVSRSKVHAAAARAARGEVALAQANYQGAAVHFAEAAALVPLDDVEERARWLGRRGYALQRQGEERDATALRQAVAAYEQALRDLPRDRAPLQWVALQNDLGNALAVLGERGDAAALRRSIVVYGTALEGTSLQQAPLHWAATQNNLANALAALGSRDGDASVLRRSVSSFEAALQVVPRERGALLWAETQSNLGAALLALGEHARDAEALLRAVKAFEAALEVRTREAYPFGWAQTQINLAVALRSLGDRGDGTGALRRALEACERALTVYTRERAPLLWAETQNTLGAVLKSLDERTSDLDILRRAVGAYDAALQVRTRERMPREWAMTQNNRGAALLALAERNDSDASLRSALQALEDARAEFRRIGLPAYVVVAERSLVRAEGLLRERDLRQRQP